MNVQNLKTGTATAARVQSSDSAHWYQKDGTPAYEVPSADGKRMVKTTLAHARKLNLLPSVTTILGELAKPQLTSWLIEQAVLAAVTTPRKDGETTDAFIHRVLQVEKQQDAERDAAANFGTTVHNELESALKAGLRAIAPGSDERVRLCVDSILALPLLQGRVVATEQCVVGPGYAGRMDCAIEHENGIVICDFKTTKNLPEESYWEHKMQLAGYANAFGNTGDKRVTTANIYISTREPGLVKVCKNEEWTKAFEAFFHVVKYWQLAKNYTP
jgi:hypothetical protein